MKPYIYIWAFSLFICLQQAAQKLGPSSTMEECFTALLIALLVPLLIVGGLAGASKARRALRAIPWDSLSGSTRLCVAAGILWTMVILPLSVAWFLNGSLVWGGAAAAMGAVWLVPILLLTVITKLTAWVFKGFNSPHPKEPTNR